MNLVQSCYDEAKKLLHSTSTPEGFIASLGGLYGNDIWGRDGSITCLGANLAEDKTESSQAQRVKRRTNMLFWPETEIPVMECRWLHPGLSSSN